MRMSSFFPASSSKRPATSGFRSPQARRWWRTACPISAPRSSGRARTAPRTQRLSASRRDSSPSFPRRTDQHTDLQFMEQRQFTEQYDRRNYLSRALLALGAELDRSPSLSNNLQAALLSRLRPT